jgi:hypothetical protein
MWLALALGVLATWESARALVAPARVVPAADWDAAADEVRAELKPGDLIVFAPRWADQVGRAHLGDVIPVDMAGRADADRYARVWEVSIRGARADETRGATRVRETRHGRVTVALYQKPAVEIVHDFTAALAEARVVSRARGGTDEQPCFADGAGGFRCGSTVIERRTLEVDYRPRRGVLAPVVGARVVAIEFADVTLGGKLVGYTGMHDFNSRKHADGPVDFRVEIDGRERLGVRHKNDDGWRRFEVDTEPGKHRVAFLISAPDPSWRTFGFHAEARK